jgi:hypothetical protein
MVKPLPSTKVRKDIYKAKPPLDTLAQLPTKGVETLKKKARSKWYTNATIQPLLKIEDSPLHKQYKNALNCCNVLEQRGNKITAKHCNSRACHICNRIRTAKFMNGYIVPLQELGELEFVTLTIPNISDHILERMVRIMIKEFSNIIRVMRERRKIDLSGIRKIEITHNEQMDTYHPHFHILVNKGIGKEIINEWLKRWPKAKRKAQDCRTANKDSLNELFKYTTKVFKKGDSKTIKINAKALDIILRALHKKRTFQTFGKISKIKISEEVEQIETQEFNDLPLNHDFDYWSWNQNDWYSFKENTPLTNYKPPDIKFVETG